LLELLRRVRTQPAAEICTRIHEAIREFAGARANVDDITLVVVKVH
jgi:serine phosphatase RsbU (regulator of sigma subunit)